MALVYWLDSLTVGMSEHARVAPIIDGADIEFPASSFSTWQANKITTGGTDFHFIPIGTAGGDWIMMLSFSLGSLINTATNFHWYFENGTDIELRCFQAGTADAPKIEWTNFGGMRYTQGGTIRAGYTGSVSYGGGGYPAGTDTTTVGTCIIKCKVSFTGITQDPVTCFVFYSGYVRHGTNNIDYFIAMQGVVIDAALFGSDQTDPSGGIPISPEGGDGKYTLHAETLNFGTAEGRSDDMGGGGLSAGGAYGTHLYDLDMTAFNSFMGTAYAGTGSLSFSDLWQAYKNSMHDPLSGILGALILPINPPDTAVTYIRLSGQSIAVSGSCGYVTKRFGETADAVVNVVPYYNTFLDYEPFTKITLYLPFVGSVGLNTNECMGGSISVRYWVDYCTGNCVAYVTLTDRAGRPSYYQYNGNCAAYIPVSGNDGGIASIISGASSVITGTVQAMSGNPAGIGSMIGGGMQIAEPKTTQKHVGGFSGGAGCVGCLYPFIVVNHPAAATAQGYTGIMGAPSAMAGTVGQYHGFTAFMHADTHGIPCTAEEMQEIDGALSEGVYL